MKNKALALSLVLLVLLSFSSCALNKEKPADLKGEWKQVDTKPNEKYQVATIDDDTIKVYWISEDEPLINFEYKSLFWTGSFIPPTTSQEPYSWDSISDYVEDGSDILISRVKSKTFTYKDNKLSYQISSNGNTYTVVFERTL